MNHARRELRRKLESCDSDATMRMSLAHGPHVGVAIPQRVKSIYLA
jgi:hypothetical protein